MRARAWDLMALLVLLTVGLLALRAALPLSQARWCLYMDEKIPYDGVQAILHASGPKALLRAVADGGDQRYGRLFYNVAAVVSAVPERLAGPQGQIIATRVLQIAAVLAALGLLLLTLLPAGPWRLIGALCLVAAAPVEYYLGMPKPEPLQALCLALFIGASAWQSWKFGGHWLLLGLAFGLKISALPAVAVFGLAALWQGRLDGALRACASFLLGWVLAVPVLLAGPQGWRAWAAWTIHNTGHGRDDLLVTWHDWLTWAVPASVPSSRTGALTLGLALALAVAWAFTRSSAVQGRARTSVWVGLAGLLWAAMVMVSVKRIWGFYLWIPLVLLHAAALGLAAWAWAQGAWLRGLGAILAISLLGSALSTEIPRLVAGLDQQRSADQAPEHLSQLQDRDALRAYLSALPSHEGPWQMHLDPHCYDPEMAPLVQRTDIWGYFNAWESAPDLIVLGPYHEASEQVPPSSVEYALNHRLAALRLQHTADAQGRCALAPCYRSQRLQRLVILRKVGAPHAR